jgi:hypothetical protein
MAKRLAIAKKVTKEVQRHEELAEKNNSATAANHLSDDDFDSGMEEAATLEVEEKEETLKTPSPKQARKKQKMVDLGDDGILTPVAGVGLVRSPVWEYTTSVEHGTVESGKSEGKTWYRMKCKLCARVVKTIGKSTTPMLRHFKSKHKDFHAKVFVVAKHNKMSPEARRLALIKPMPFDEAFPHHIKYMYMVSHDQRTLSVGQTEKFREYLAGYNKQARPPAFKTLDRLLLATNIVMKRKISAAMHKTVDELREVGLKAPALQSDLWFGKDKRSYLGKNCTWIDKVVTTDKRGRALIKFKMMTDFLALHAFPSYTHIGKAIAETTLADLNEYSVMPFDITLSTIDGAANGVKAM